MSSTAFTHTCRIALAAAPARVFEALTSSTGLSHWFAEHAHVELAVGGAFRFWGRYTYGTPTRDQATQRITGLDAPRQIRFAWTFDGTESDVSWVISTADGDPTRSVLDVTHTCANRPAARHAEALVDDLWRLHLANLSTYLSGGRVSRIDFADPAPEIRLAIAIDAPVARVYRALTEPAALNRWVAKDAHVELAVGGRYDWGWAVRAGGGQAPTGPTTILELVPHAKLVTDWPDWRGDPTQPKSRVSWILDAVGDSQTRVTLVHDRFARVVDLGDYPFGWLDVLGKLKGEAERAS